MILADQSHSKIKRGLGVSQELSIYLYLYKYIISSTFYIEAINFIRILSFRQSDYDRGGYFNGHKT